LFYHTNYKDKKSKTAHLWKLNNIILEVLSNTNTIIIALNTSIRNNIVISIAYIHSHSNIIKKIIYYAINITTTEVELFAIRCEINQAVQIIDTSYIIIITDSIYLVH